MFSLYPTECRLSSKACSFCRSDSSPTVRSCTPPILDNMPEIPSGFVYFSFIVSIINGKKKKKVVGALVCYLTWDCHVWRRVLDNETFCILCFNNLSNDLISSLNGNWELSVIMFIIDHDLVSVQLHNDWRINYIYFNRSCPDNDRLKSIYRILKRGQDSRITLHLRPFFMCQ